MDADLKTLELDKDAPRRSMQRLVRRSRFRWQHCTECGHEGIGLAVLHLQDCFPCPVCKHSTVRRYGSPNSVVSANSVDVLTPEMACKDKPNQ